MTRFEKDYRAIKENSVEAFEILRERKQELNETYKKGKAEKNGFRRQILANEFVKLSTEYDKLQELI